MRGQRLWPGAALGMSALLIQLFAGEALAQEVPEETILAFGLDGSDNLVIQKPANYGEMGIPIVGDPVCTQFVDPCPRRSQPSPGGAQSAPETFAISTPTGTDWKVQWESAGESTEDSFGISTNQKSATVRVAPLGDWNAELEKLEPKRWDLSVLMKTPETSAGGGCWVEAPCPAPKED